MTTLQSITSALRTIDRAAVSEVDLHQQIERCLFAAGMLHEREVPTATGPVDFVVHGTTLLEVKVKGSGLVVARQVARYLEDARFAEAVVVTSRPMSLPIEEVTTEYGTVKPIHMIELWRNFF